MDSTNMPATKERDPSGNLPPELGRIIEKIKRRGSMSLSEGERIMIVQIFRVAALTAERRVVDARDAIQKAHLEFCFKMEGLR